MPRSHGATCECFEGFWGEECEVELRTSSCRSNPCLNGATCNQYTGRYVCYCTSGWQGVNCEQDVDECQVSTSWRNGGTCLNSPGTYSCACASGFTGSSCAIDLNECLSLPCFQGECLNGINEFKCVCREGYKGTLCDEESPSTSDTESAGPAWFTLFVAIIAILAIVVSVFVGVYAFLKLRGRLNQGGLQKLDRSVRHAASASTRNTSMASTVGERDMYERVNVARAEPAVYTNLGI